MDQGLRELKRAVERGPVGRSGFPVAVREQVVALARRRQAAGESLRDVASAFGISHETLRRWVKHGVSTFRRVRTEAAPTSASASGGIVLRLPSGTVVEGLRVEDVAAVLRALG